MNYHTNNVTENRFYSTVKPGWKLPGILALLVAIGFAGCDQITSTDQEVDELEEAVGPYEQERTSPLSSGDVDGEAVFIDMNENTAMDLAETIAGNGIENITNVSFTGDEKSGGTFEFSGDHDVIGLSSGVSLSSGKVSSAEGPNENSATSTGFGNDGDDDLSALAGITTFDAAVLEFDFEVPADAQTISIDYVFGSEDYNQFVGSDFSDIMAIFVNGDNCATVDGEPIRSNTINNGNASTDPSNPDLFISNDPFFEDADGETVSDDDLLFTEMDGFTVVLTCEADVVAEETNTIKLAIADANNDIIDSWAYFGEDSFEPDVTEVDDPEEAEGCGPGFWRNSAIDQGIWTEDDDFGPSDKTGDVFNLAVEEVDNGGPGNGRGGPPGSGDDPKDRTLQESLDGGGGPGVKGAQRILLRAAVAGLLNAQNVDIFYEIPTTDEVINEVNEALDTQDRGIILELADSLDDYNNQECPL